AASWPWMPRSMAGPLLAPLEVRGPLLEERLEPLGGVLGADHLVEGANLDLDGLVDWRLQAVVHRLDQHPGGEGRPLPQLARQRLRVGERLALLGKSVHQPDAVTLLGGDLRAEDQVLEGQPAPDQAGQTLGAAVAGDDAEAGLGLPHPRRLPEDADVAAHRDLAATPQRVAIDGGDHRLGKALDAPDHAIAEA